jgi:hypothetical protein
MWAARGPITPVAASWWLRCRPRGRVPFCNATTASPEVAAALYAERALVLNVPLNHDLNHRFFEVMTAGAHQLLRLLAQPARL